MTHPLSVVIHGHFYQPPREDPGTDAVPAEPSAAPFHDWNQRIHDQCYGPVTAARLLSAAGRVRTFTNALASMSFDAAPTLLRWLEREAPATYEAFVDADRQARLRTGHGNALATSYHHVILPLASPADRRAEIRWGLADFRRRFGREPVGFWLPEAAVDGPTLEALADEGVGFVVLGHGQVQDLPPRGMPGRTPLPGGREIAVFVYDGGLAHGVSFGALIGDSDLWADAVLAHRDPDGPALASLATDGETFGHHHVFGEMALASVIERLGSEPGVHVTHFEAVLDAHPPAHDVRVVDPSSWSCPHGVDRWHRECGCGSVYGQAPGGQAWRAPLRAGLTVLGAGLAELYTDRAPDLLADPAGARDRFATVLDASLAEREAFVDAEAGRPLESHERVRALGLLEMQRWALCMFTSCAWFFDALDRVEPRIALRAAGHALGLVDDDTRRSLATALMHTLAEAPADDGRTGADLWREVVDAPPPAAERVASTVVQARAVGLDLGGDERTRIGPWRASTNGARLELVDQRTGRAHRFDTDEVPALPLETLPYPFGVRLADARAAAHLRDEVGPAGIDAVLAGRWSLEQAWARALVHRLEQVDSLEPGDLTRIGDLLARLAEGPGVPPPVQEVVWRAHGRSALPGSLLVLAGLEPPEPPP